MIDLLGFLTQDRILPEGCDEWGIRSVKPDFSSSRDYRWPFPGNWAESSGPHVTENRSPCPSAKGDGICLAYTWAGMASGGISAHTLLLCAYRSCDVLGRDSNKVRLVKAFVVEVIDGCDLLTKHGAGADLSRANLPEANLSEANLYGANLSEANLPGADLSEANLYGADLSRANLSRTNLYRADLSRTNLYRADLSRANLYRADLSRANLYGADLSEANLSEANLSRADLSRADLSEIRYDKNTMWPEGFKLP